MSNADADQEIGDRVVRPAMVVVGRGGGGTREAGGGTRDGDTQEDVTG